MMRKFVSLIAAMAVLGLVAVAQDQAKSVTLNGVLMDKACSARHLKADKPQESAANDTKSCALKDGCFKSGLGVFSDGKFTPFADEKSNALAKAALEKTSKDKGATFKVVGKITDGKMTAESISEL